MTAASPARTRPGPRERLLAAATDLMYSSGAGVGVDAILERADVARRSLYQHFGGKDGLIEEVLRLAAEKSEHEYQVALEAGGSDPRQRLLSVFDSVTTIIGREGFRGCRYINADLTLIDTHPAHHVTSEHKRRVRELLESELASLGHPDPLFAAEQLQLLIDGALVIGGTRSGGDPARAARTLAEHVLNDAT